MPAARVFPSGDLSRFLEILESFRVSVGHESRQARHFLTEGQGAKNTNENSIFIGEQIRVLEPPRTMGSSASSKRPNDKHKNRLQSQPAVDRVSASALAALGADQFSIFTHSPVVGVSPAAFVRFGGRSLPYADAERKGFVDERGLVKLLKAMKYPGGLDELKKRVSQLIEADADSNRVWTMEELQSWWNRQNFTIDDMCEERRDGGRYDRLLGMKSTENSCCRMAQGLERCECNPGSLHEPASFRYPPVTILGHVGWRDNIKDIIVQDWERELHGPGRGGKGHKRSATISRTEGSIGLYSDAYLHKLFKNKRKELSSQKEKAQKTAQQAENDNKLATSVEEELVSMAFDRLEEMEFETENTKKNNRKDEGGSVGSDGDTRSKRGADGIVPPTSSLASRVRSTLQLRIRSQSSASSGSSLAGGGFLCMSPTLRRETEEGSKENGSSSGEGTDGNERKGEEGREGKDRNGPSSATASPSVRKALPNSESPSPAASAAFGDEKSTTQPQLLRQYTNEAKKILAELFVLEYVHMSCEKNKYKRMVNRGIITAHEYRTKSNEIGAEFQRKYGAALGEIKSELERTGQFDRSKTNIGKVPGMFDDDGGGTDSDEDDDDECPASPGPIFRARSRQRREGISEEPHNEPLGMFRVDDNKTRRDTYTLSMKYSTVDDNGGFLDQ
eukprot:jgi/Bigna1/71953/fgenesh1_pg.17_\